MTAHKAKASPTKAFFVRMLTRDISLEDCILDLVDNSIDSAWKHSGDIPTGLVNSESLAPYKIAITLDDSSFRIVDNCGGISLDDAVNYAFTFGRFEDSDEDAVDEGQPETEANDDIGRVDHHDFSVGVYGIGMKRAVFKLGRSIVVRSTHADNGHVESFEVPIDVPDWVANDVVPWDFDIEESPALPSPGVEIEIGELTPSANERFRDPTFVPSLKRILSRDYMLPLMRGLVLELNDDQIVGWKVEMKEGEGFAPMRSTYQDGTVQVEIVAGMVAPPPDETGPEEPTRRDEVSGWYVACNGRVVVAADRGPVTGWGSSDIPRWHPQYLGFVGLAFFSAADSDLLPMTTTKRSVDLSSELYRRALVKMGQPTRAWIDYTNDRKADIESARAVEERASSRPLPSLAIRPEVNLPSMRGRGGPRRANINYSVELSRLRKLADALGNINMTYRDVGLKAFDYTYEQWVDEDDE